PVPTPGLHPFPTRRSSDLQCGREIAAQTVQQIVDRLMLLPDRTRIHILAPLVRDRKGEYRKELLDLRKAGFVRARVDGKLRDLRDRKSTRLNSSHVSISYA